MRLALTWLLALTAALVLALSMPGGDEVRPAAAQIPAPSGGGSGAGGGRTSGPQASSIILLALSGAALVVLARRSTIFSSE